MFMFKQNKDLNLTLVCFRTCVVWRTQTGVVSHSVHTGGAVLTAVILTIVHVHLAERSVETKGARTAGETKKRHLNIIIQASD